MKKLLSILILLAIITSCEKDSNDDDQEVQPVNVTYSFDSQSTIGSWNITTPNNAIVTIDTEDKVAGEGSLKIYSGCCVLDQKNGIQLVPNTNYGITINAKRTPWGPTDTICTYQHPVGLYILQGGIELFSTPIGNSPNWKNEVFYFNSLEGTEPVKMRIMINSKEVWIDELKFEEI